MESGSVGSGQFVVHPAGRYGLRVLQRATDVGAIPLAIHPALPLTGTTMDLERLSGAAFGVTAPEGMRTVAEALVVELGAEPVWVPEEARGRYHAALAFAANYAMTLVNSSLALLRDANTESPERLIGPLVRASVETALERGEGGQTGPISRADDATVAEHLALLSEQAPLVAQAYRALGLLTVDRLLDARQHPGPPRRDRSPRWQSANETALRRSQHQSLGGVLACRHVRCPVDAAPSRVGRCMGGRQSHLLHTPWARAAFPHIHRRRYGDRPPNRRASCTGT